MEDQLKSPTETHTSRSSFNPFVNRPKFEGLKDRAGAAFRAIMPKRRRRTAPCSLRPERPITQNTSGQRPATAIIQEAQQPQGSGSGTVVATSEVATPSQVQAATSDDQTVQISRLLFSKMVELAKCDQDLTLAETLTGSGVGRLEILEMRVKTVDRNAAEMQRWLRDTRDVDAQGSEDPESSYRQTDADIAMYRDRMAEMHRHVRNIVDQRHRMRSKIDELKNEHGRLQAEILYTVREDWPDLVEKGTTLIIDPDSFTKLPLDPKGLVTYEEEYQDFSKATTGEADPRRDYPFAETGDYVDRVLHMRDCKDDYEAAVMYLTELRESGKQTSEEELRLQTEDVQLMAQTLADAIEESRRAGVHVKDDGSEILNIPGGPFWDLTRHGHETIIGYMDEDGEIHLHDEEPISEATQDEVRAYYERSQHTAQTWLDGESLGTDPNEAGPATPRTPATPGYQSRMRDVEIGETPNRESNGILIADASGEYQAQLAEWKATQDRDRIEAAALITEHKRSMDDAWS